MIESQKIKRFFNEIANLTGDYKDDIFVILVTHLVQDREYFIEALSKVVTIGIIIPKPNSINKEVKNILSENYFIYETTRTKISQEPSIICDLIKEKNTNNKKIVILDIGGYFSGIIDKLSYEFGNNFIGIIEDTENGHQKYVEGLSTTDNFIKDKKYIFSVARSPLKNTEDFLVGLSICFSAEAVLREVNEIFTGRIALVLGYGKIDYSIAKHLAERNINVYVYDVNPLRLVEAKSHGHNVLTREDSLKIADIVFCATGNKALKEDDIYNLKPNCVIFTSTSSDDELSIPGIIADFKEIKSLSLHITSMTTQKGNTYHLCNGGNAVNFLHGASVGPFIFLVQSEIIMSIKSLMEAHEERSNTFANINGRNKNEKILVNSAQIQKIIANCWLKFYGTDSR